MEVTKIQKLCDACNSNWADTLKHLEEELRAPESLSSVLVRAERALVRLLGIRSARELPISFQEFVYGQQDLRQLIDSMGAQSKDLDSAASMSNVTEADKGRPVANFDGQLLLEHCLELMQQCLAEVDGAVGSEGPPKIVHQLLQCFGKAEHALCQAYGMKSFAGFGLSEKLFSEFVTRYSRPIADQLAMSFGGPTISNLPAVVKLLKLLGRAPERLSQHFFGLSTPKSFLNVDLAFVNDEPEEILATCPPRELQVLLARSGLGEEKSVTHSCLASEERRSGLVTKAVEAISHVPELTDLAGALPEWKTDFEPNLGSLFEFLDNLQNRRDTIPIGSRFSGLPPLAVIEVRCGLLMRLTDGAFATFEAALEAKDPRKAAATVMSRLVADGHQAPMQRSCS